MEYEAAGRGNNRAGGQKQRLFIARALADDPEILILDDASSALDYRTDAMLRRAVAENYPDAAKIVIAQRISSVMEADEILVMDNGQICGFGSHEELLLSCPLYKEIYDVQMSREVS